MDPLTGQLGEALGIEVDRDVRSTVRAPCPRAIRSASWVSAVPAPCLLAASSTTTSSIQARTPVGIGKTASVRVPMISPGPPVAASPRATSTVLDEAPTTRASAAWSSGGADLDSCGSSRPKALTVSSVTSRSTST